MIDSSEELCFYTAGTLRNTDIEYKKINLRSFTRSEDIVKELVNIHSLLEKERNQYRNPNKFISIQSKPDRKIIRLISELGYIYYTNKFGNFVISWEKKKRSYSIERFSSLVQYFTSILIRPIKKQRFLSIGYENVKNCYEEENTDNSIYPSKIEK